MLTSSVIPQTIEKEAVVGLKFPTEDVLAEDDAKARRAKQLLKAMSLGNLNKFKVKIAFEDDQNIKSIYTTIWAITEKNLVLKAGMTVPRHRVHSVEFV